MTKEQPFEKALVIMAKHSLYENLEGYSVCGHETIADNFKTLFVFFGRLPKETRQAAINALITRHKAYNVYEKLEETKK